MVKTETRPARKLLSVKKSSNGQMPVVIFKESGVWFAHCPALEITGYGHSEREARDSFDIMLAEFFRYAEENGNLHSELKRLGWQVETHTPPPFEKLISRDETLKQLFDMQPVKTILEPVPAYA
jgi:hypothetical protein